MLNIYKISMTVANIHSELTVNLLTILTTKIPNVKKKQNGKSPSNIAFKTIRLLKVILTIKCTSDGRLQRAEQTGLE